MYRHTCSYWCAQVEAEEVPEVTERLGVTVVPYFAILKVRS